MGCLLFDYEFGGAYYNIYVCFEQKTAVVMQHFRNLGASGGGSDHFLTKPPKGTSLILRVLSHYACVSVYAFCR